MSITVVCVSDDGSLKLESIEITTNRTIPLDFFDCKICNIKNEFVNIGITSFTQDSFLYINYFSDMHSKNSSCAAPINKYSTELFDTECGCGHSTIYNYRGPIYFMKHIKDSWHLPPSKTIRDCDQKDLIYIQDQLIQLKIDRKREGALPLSNPAYGTILILLIIIYLLFIQ